MIVAPPWPSAFSVRLKKLRRYLLDDQSEDGADKANFLARYGFTPFDTMFLLEAVAAHPRTSACVLPGRTKLNDPRLTYEGPLATLDGRNPILLTGWELLPDGTAQFVTLIPRPFRPSQRARAYLFGSTPSDRP